MTGALQLGSVALREGRWADARDAFADALASEPTAEALSGLGEALWWLGDMPGSVAHHERAYAAFCRRRDSQQAALTAMTLSITSASNFGDYAAASGWAARARRHVASVSDPEVECWLEVTLGYATEDADLARQHRQRALDLSRLTGDPDLELCALSALGEGLVLAGQVRAGLALVDEAMAATLAGEAQRLDTVAYTCCDMIVACSVAGDVARASQWCRLADRFIGRYGCPFLYARCRISYGELLMLTGRWTQADEQLTLAAAMTASAGPSLQVQCASVLAELRVRQGRLDEAERIVAHLAGEPQAAAVVARVRLATGEPLVAATVIDRRLRGGGEQPIRTAVLLGLLVEARLAGGELDAAETALGRLTDLAATCDHPLPRAHATLARGRMARCSDGEGSDVSRAAAVTVLEQAVELFGRLGRPFETAVARRELAAALAGQEAQVAVAEARLALLQLDALGAAAEADATAALLRSLGAPGRRAPRSGAALTRREEEVLQLLGLGLSNPEIARRLFISRKTAAHHVSAVLAKLGVQRRSEAAVVAARRQPAG